MAGDEDFWPFLSELCRRCVGCTLCFNAFAKEKSGCLKLELAEVEGLLSASVIQVRGILDAM